MSNSPNILIIRFEDRNSERSEHNLTLHCLLKLKVRVWWVMIHQSVPSPLLLPTENDQFTTLWTSVLHLPPRIPQNGKCTEENVRYITMVLLNPDLSRWNVLREIFEITYSGGVPSRLNSSKIIWTLSPGQDKVIRLFLKSEGSHLAELWSCMYTVWHGPRDWGTPGPWRFHSWTWCWW